MKLFFLIFIFALTLNANNFYSIGVGNNTFDYIDKTTTNYKTKTNKELMFEYGYDNMQTYRLYFDGQLSSENQSIGAMAEYAQRLRFLPSWIKQAVGLPTISFGIGYGYNNTEIQNDTINSTSFNMNYGLMFELDRYILKIGNKIKDYQSTTVNSHDYDLSSDVKYIMIQINY
jgi:hypothetical protein